MALFQNDNEDVVYKALIDKHKDLAFNIALKITKNEQDSEEIVQDSFVKAFNGLNKFRNESQFSTWFYKIVYNTAISATRRKKIDTVEVNDKVSDVLACDQIESVLEKLDDSDRKILISDSLSKLNELDYTILSLYYYEGLSLKEISKVVGKKSNYLKVLLQRARIKLYESFSKPLEQELIELI